MKTLRLLPILLFMLSFTACKENEKGPEPLDISKYMLVGRTKYQNAQLPFLLTLNPDGKVQNYSQFNSNANSSYTYKDDLLTLNLGGTGPAVELKISDEKIISSTAGSNVSYMLIKIPETNQLSGNTYNGGRRETASSLSYLSRLKFNDSQYGENTLNEPVPDKNYVSIKNIAALSIIGTTQHFWILMDGKLEYGGFNSSNQKVYVGTYQPQ